MIEILRRARRFIARFFIAARSVWLRPVRPFCSPLAGRTRLLAVAMPLLSSLPEAPVSIYLDFDGHQQASWGAFTNIVSPPFDIDGDLNSSSAAECESIREIWARVAEDYAPFHINVTTIDPRDCSDRHGIHVVIGGHYADWYRVRVGGVSFNNSFTNSQPNLVYVFSTALAGGTPKYVADLISHEVGHTFGLEEQSVYGERGTRVRDYNSGDARIWGPLMGNSLAALRSIWHCGTSTSSHTIQDDVAIIASRENGFGLRPDDHSGDHDLATALDSHDNRFAATGVIATVMDQDVFTFQCPGGQVQLAVHVSAAGPNLDVRLELRSSNGEMLEYSDPANDLQASISAKLPGGKYFAVVRSHGSYGDLGQYTLAGSMELPPINVARIDHVKATDAYQPMAVESLTIRGGDLSEDSKPAADGGGR